MAKRNAEQRDPSGVLKWILIAVFILVLTAVVWLSFDHFLTLNKARMALYDAKTACLAASSVSLEYAALGTPFTDAYRANGLSEDAEKAIVKLGELSGNLVVVQPEKNGYGFTALTYELDGYIVEYTAEDGKEKWQVFKKTALITA